MSISALQEYTRISKYSRYNKEAKRRETWSEQVARVMEMHRIRYKNFLPDIENDLQFVEDLLLKKKLLGSQRALQFASDPILKHNARLYNCCASHCDRPKFFQECMYLLLCGCGVGFSAQTHHIAKLPTIKKPSGIKKTFLISDSIEGWADAIGVLMSSYFTNEQPFPEYADRSIEFNFLQIRSKGAPLSHGSKAPGPEPLKRTLLLIKEILDKALENKLFVNLRPIECYDIIMHAADAVISGGVRRSATICLFSPDDIEMVRAKTGDWYITNPQRGRSNNSALLLRNKVKLEEFKVLMESVKQFGEPGFVWSDSTELIVNPCVEIGMWPVDEVSGLSGWQFCNLCEMNMRKCKTEDDFYNICKGAAILGTFQAGYHSFPYLGKTSENIVKREALLGVSMTGMMDSAEIAFDPEIQKEGAKLVLKINEEIAKKIKINPAARATCVKPAGTTSCLLGTASGIHPHHAKRYFRRVQANELEAPLQHFIKYNPLAVEDSVWDPNHVTKAITFVCEVPDGSKTKNQVDAITLLDHVKLTQQNWVAYGTRHKAMTKPWLRHNVSNTINVQEHEWEIVTSYIYNNRANFAGIALLSSKGDKDIPQAPFTTVLTDGEILREYGKGSLLASGLIVDGLQAWNNNLWAACDCLFGIGEDLELESKRLHEKHEDDLFQTIAEAFSGVPIDQIPDEYYEIAIHFKKKEWIRRALQFAERYFDNDIKQMTYCLKDVSNYKLWLDLSREYIDVPWESMTEDQDNTTPQETIACSGGSCDM